MLALSPLLQTSPGRLAEEYGLEGPLAASGIRVPYTPGQSGTDRMICMVSRCTGRPWPVPLTGVNDGQECL